MAYMTLIAVFFLAGSMLLGESLTEGLISMGITPCGIGVLEVIILQFILFSAFFSNFIYNSRDQIPMCQTCIQ